MECINGINTFYWHREQLCIFKAQRRVLTMFIVEMKRELLGGNKSTYGEISAIAHIVSSFAGEDRLPAGWPRLGLCWVPAVEMSLCSIHPLVA